MLRVFLSRDEGLRGRREEKRGGERVWFCYRKGCREMRERDEVLEREARGGGER